MKSSQLAAAFLMLIASGLGQLARALPPDSLTTQLIARADSSRKLLNANQDTKAFALLRTALRNPLRQQSPLGTLHLYYQLGVAERKVSHLSESLAALNRANQIATQLRDTAQLFRVGYSLSVVYADMGLFERAVGQSHRNLTYANNRSDMVMRVVPMLIELYKRLGNQRALDTYRRQYIQLSGNSKNPFDRMNAWVVQAEQWEDKKRYDLALVNYTKAVGVARTMDSADALAEVLMLQARMHQKLRQWNTALKALNEAKYWESRYRSIPAQTVIYRQIANVLAAQGRYKAAVASAQKSVALSYESQRPDALLASLDTLQHIQSLDGQYQAAWLTAKTLRRLTDSLATIAKVEAVAQIETRYKVAASEATIQNLRKDAVNKKLQAENRERALETIKRQQLILVGLLVSLLLGLGGIGWLFVRTRRLQQQTEAQRQLLEVQAGELQEVNANKDRLFSIVSHDLRAPIMNLHTLVQEVEQTSVQPERWPVLASQLSERLHQLTRLTNNLLYWSLAQQGLLRDRPDWIDMGEIVAECQHLFGGAIHQKSLRVNISGPAVSVWADENQVQIIVRNLLDNVVKFSPVGGIVRIEWASYPDSVGMAISNQVVAQPEQLAGVDLGLRVIGELLERQNGTIASSRSGESVWKTEVRWTQSPAVISGREPQQKTVERKQ